MAVLRWWYVSTYNRAQFWACPAGHKHRADSEIAERRAWVLVIPGLAAKALGLHCWDGVEVVTSARGRGQEATAVGRGRVTLQRIEEALETASQYAGSTKAQRAACRTAVPRAHAEVARLTRLEKQEYLPVAV